MWLGWHGGSFPKGFCRKGNVEPCFCLDGAGFPNQPVCVHVCVLLKKVGSAPQYTAVPFKGKSKPLLLCLASMRCRLQNLGGQRQPQDVGIFASRGMPDLQVLFVALQ